MQPIYDLRCEQCGSQLDFYETQDGEGDTIVHVSPCPICCGSRQKEVEYAD